MVTPLISSTDLNVKTKIQSPHLTLEVEWVKNSTVPPVWYGEIACYVQGVKFLFFPILGGHAFLFSPIFLRKPPIFPIFWFMVYKE